MEYIISFFNSNFFIALVAFIVGGLAIYLYIRQKKDYKRDAASIILMEIRHAEKSIDQLKGGGLTGLDIVLLPTNNWAKYNYLFIKDLDRDELDLINNLYNKCSVIDKALSQMSIASQLEQKSGYIHQSLVQIARKAVNQVDYDNKKKNFIDIIEKEGYRFKPDAPKNTIVIALGNIEKVTISTAGSKLKKLAKM